jgi:PadR family transcriptional regulator PadR
MTEPTDLVQSTLDLLILKTIHLAPAHGWAIAQRIRQGSTNVGKVTPGALYPALHFFEQQGWIKGAWGESENNRRAKYYSLSRAGKTILKNEEENWCRLSDAIGLVLKMT